MINFPTHKLQISSNTPNKKPEQNTPSFLHKVVSTVALFTVTLIASEALESIDPRLARVVRWIGGGIGLINLFTRSTHASPPISSSNTFTHQKPTPVLICSIDLLNKTLTFKKIANHILVTVENYRKKTKTEMLLDKTSFANVPLDLFSEREKIQWLFTNQHFEMICQKNEKKVYFAMIAPALLEWKIIKELTFTQNFPSSQYQQSQASLHTQKALGFTHPSICAFCRLFDGTVALGGKNGAFFIYDTQRNCLFSGNFKVEILDIVEHQDGLLTIKTLQNTFILCPKKKINPTLEAIKKLKQEIKLFPYDFPLYQNLANMYKTLDDPKEFKIYEKSIKAIAKCPNRYQARRFIKQSVAHSPEKINFYEHYLNYLDQNKSNRSERKGVCLKLYRVLNEEREKLIKIIPRTYSRDEPIFEKLMINYRKQMDLLQRIREFSRKGYKTRLLIGEGNFTYAENLIHIHQETHSELGKSIIATEFQTPTEQTTRERVNSLIKQGVSVYFNVDAKNLHLQFNQRIPRIHWNCPNGGGTIQQKEQFKGTVIHFFQSGSKLQKAGDRIHITLLQEPNIWQVRQNQCDLVKAATESNYHLVRKRLFHERYPGYQHKKTNGNDSIDSKKREFVFEKVQIIPKFTIPKDLQIKAQALCDPEIKVFQVKTQKKTNYYFDCSTDDDSSDYYDSDSV